MKLSATQPTNKAIVAYVPVLHEGYRRFFEKHADARTLLLLGSDVSGQFRQLEKDIRALPPEMIKRSIESWKLFDEIRILNVSDLAGLSGNLIAPDEDVMHDLHKAHFPEAHVEFDPIFLRWDKHKSTEGRPVAIDQRISKDDKDVEIIALLEKEANKSSDWWRHVGAAIVKEGRIISMSHNAHVPHEQIPYVNGDPRSDFSKGVSVELSTAIHAEASLIAEAAREGTPLEGAVMYVTTFPCPPCAKLIAYSGIKKLYYSGGYGMLDGESILKSKGVEIYFVDTR